MNRPNRVVGDSKGYHEAVRKAVESFEKRWTMASLFSIDRDLHLRLYEQRRLWEDAVESGEPEDIRVQAGGMQRGYRYAIAVMEKAMGEVDTAYLVGRSKGGMLVAVGHQKASAEHASEKYGQVVWISPGEVADLLEAVPEFRMAALTKRLFPGAELVDIRTGNPDPKAV